MPIYHFIRERHAVVISVHVGATSDDEFLDAYEALYANPQFSHDYRQLIDLSSADSRPRSATALKRVSYLVMRTFKDDLEVPRFALVAPHDLSFGLSRMYEVFRDELPGEVLVTRNPLEATKWLDIPHEILTEVNVEAHNKAAPADAESPAAD